MKNFINFLKMKVKKVHVILIALVFIFCASGFAYAMSINVNSDTNPNDEFGWVQNASFHGQTLTTGFKYANGNQGDVVYCMNPTKATPLNVNENEQGGTSNQIFTVLKNGYPNNPNLHWSKNQNYYITQIAVWVVDGWFKIPGINNPNTKPHANTIECNGSGFQAQWGEIKNLVNQALFHTEKPNDWMNLSNPSSGKFIKQGNGYATPNVTMNTYNLNGTATISLTGAPSGTQIWVNGQQTNKINPGQSFHLFVPESIADQGLNIHYGISLNGTKLLPGYFTPSGPNSGHWQEVARAYPVPASANAGGTFSMNAQLAQLRVLKYSESTHQLLSGCTFGLYQNGKLIQKQQTNNAGVAHFNGIVPGAYKIKELSAPQGYIVSDKVINATVSAGEDKINGLAMYDAEKTTQITITKTNGLGTKLAGATFGLYDGGKLVGQKTTNANGVCNWSGLKFGNYSVKELTPPTGYTLDTTPWTTTINASNAGGNITHTFTDNERGTTLTIIKTDKVNGDKLAGATFGLFQGGKQLETQTTGTDGQCSFTNIIFGNYTIREITAPKGFNLSNQVWNVTLNSSNAGKTQTYTFSDSPIQGKIEVIKYVSRTKTPISGVTFGIFHNGSQVATLTTNKEGQAISGNLNYGHYIVKELNAPDAYYLVSSTFPINITENGKTYTQEVSDKVAACKLRIVKEDGTNGDVLSGATFKILQNGKPITQTYTVDGHKISASEWTTNAKGEILLPELLQPGTYTLEEVTAPYGYELAKPVTFSFNRNTKFGPNMTYTIGIKDMPINGQVELVKDSSLTDKPMANVQFALYEKGAVQHGTKSTVKDFNIWNTTKDFVLHLFSKESDKATAPSVDGSHLVGVYTTNSEGQIKVTGLRVGHYFFKELKATQGYLINKNNQDFTISNNNLSPVVKVVDHPITNKVEISKVNMTNDKPVAGATIKITCTSGLDKGKTWTWVSTLTPHELTLPWGKYTYKEVDAPVGYNINTTIGHFTVTKEGDIIKCVVKDKPITGELVIKKTDVTNGKPLADAKFDIYNSKGEVVASGATGSEGTATFHLGYGHYTYQEVVAPKGFFVRVGRFPFSITKQGEIVRATVSDQAFPKTGGIYNESSQDTLLMLCGGSLLGIIGLGIYEGNKRRKRNRA